jgi:predicted ArsR family transcriptional regulator
MSNVTKPQTPPSLLRILVAIREAKPGRQGVTAAEVKTDAIRLGRLQERGLVRVVGTVKSGKRGRPAHRYGLTDTGRNRAARARV